MIEAPTRETPEIRRLERMIFEEAEARRSLPEIRVEEEVDDRRRLSEEELFRAYGVGR